MPYVLVEHNRYIGEHDCHQHHFGDMTLVRECCVADCQHWNQVARKVAMSDQHPAYRMFRAAYESLTDAERKQVKNFRIRFDGEIEER